MSAAKKLARILDDNRIGNLNQLKAISYYLKDELDFVEKKVNFSCTIFLPNFIHIFLNTGTSLEHFETDKHPDFIFAAGRRSALVAVRLKKLFPKAQLVQIMRPSLKPNHFSFITTPKHDNFKAADYEMLIAPNFINEATLKDTAKKWPKLKQTKKKTLTVIIGGSTAHKKVTAKAALRLCYAITDLQKKYNAETLVTTSRRTGANFENILKAKLTDNTQIFCWDDIKDKNPYLAMLAKADYLLVTADSVSMIGDCIATGKPTLVYSDGFGNKKHLSLTYNLAEAGLIKTELSIADKDLFDYEYEPVCEAKNIADAVRLKLKL